MRLLAATCLLVPIVFQSVALAAPPATEKEKTNYAVGYQIGGDFRRQGIELDAEQLVQGIRDAQMGGKTQMPQAEMTRMLSILKSRVTAGTQARKGVKFEADMKEGRAFMEANAKMAGVVTLPNGVQYRVVREGSGPVPALLDNVSVRYTGRLAGGSEFYSNRKAPEPASLAVGNFIPGMRDVIMLMKEGARFEAFVPGGELGYAPGNPLYGKTVVFDIELLKVNPKI